MGDVCLYINYKKYIATFLVLELCRFILDFGFYGDCSVLRDVTVCTNSITLFYA
jgi:hypothetical protein